MNNEIKKMTPQQAIEQGYTHYTVDQTDIWHPIEHFSEYGRTDPYPFKKLLLLDKNKTAFSISSETIKGLLEDHIDNQEDFYCEDGSMYNELDEADFEKIAELVNVGFKKRFMFPTEIELVSDEKEANS